MRVIFLGTPAFAATVLESIDRSEHEVVGVVTQPDKANARGNKVVFSPVKSYASERGIPVFQYRNISSEGEEELKSLSADIMVTAAYGQILKENILSLCPHGVINVHASLLPQYRGSSPVQWAIINGEKELGVTIMQTERGVDTGDMILKDSIVLDGTENSAEALEKLSVLGSRLIVNALDKIQDGTAQFEKQDKKHATHCRMLTKEDGKLDFSLPAQKVVNLVRGLNPWPGTFTNTPNGVIKVITASVCEGSGKAGEVIASDSKKGLVVACGDKAVSIVRVKPENGKEMDAKAYLLGKKIPLGSVLCE